MSGPVVYGKQPFAGSLRAGHARPLPVHYMLVCRGGIHPSRVVGDADPYRRGGFHIRPGTPWPRQAPRRGQDPSLRFPFFIIPLFQL